MSLDIYLTEHPRCPTCGYTNTKVSTFSHSQNITHNLGVMADEAGIYEALWHPHEAGIEIAQQLIPLLSEAIKQMKNDPKRFEKFNSANGWGLYKHFLPFLEELLEVCIQHPTCEVESST